MNTHRSAERKRPGWFTWLRITGIIIFIVVLSQFDLGEIWKQIRVISPGFLLLAILSQLVLLIVKGIRWHRMVKRSHTRIGFLQSMGEFMESYAIGVITPGRMGELMKAGYQNSRGGIFASGLKVVAERGLDVGFFIVVAGAALSFETLIQLPPAPGYILLAAGALVFLLSVLLINSRVSLTFLNRVFSKYSSSFDRHNNRSSFSIVILSLISNAFAFISCWFIVLGIGMPVSLLGLSGGVALAGLLNMLPVTIMGLGTRELTFLFVFSQFPETQVLALSGLIFLVAQIGGGLMAMFMGQFFLALKKRESKKTP